MAERQKGGKRPYRMKARAAAAEATRERILEACEAAFTELRFDDLTLGAVAERAGVSVQTVIRHFQTKDNLLVATLGHAAMRMASDREVPAGGEPEEIIGTLFDHYEEFGDRLLWMLAQEDRVPTLGVLANAGRSYHLEWCKRAFEPALRGLRGARRDRRVAQLVALTDIYVWKVLRRDRGLSVAATKLAVLELLEPLARKPG
jgi:AcrR family transcriptional regulator